MPSAKQYGKMALLTVNLLILINHGNACERISEGTGDVPPIKDPINGSLEKMMVPPADAPVQASDAKIPADEIDPDTLEKLSERDLYVAFIHPKIQYALTHYDAIWTYYVEPIVYQRAKSNHEDRIAQLDESSLLYSKLKDYLRNGMFQEEMESDVDPALQEFQKHFSRALDSQIQANSLFKEGMEQGDGTNQHDAIQTRAAKIEGHWKKSANHMDEAFHFISQYEESLELVPKSEENWYQAFYRSDDGDRNAKLMLE